MRKNAPALRLQGSEVELFIKQNPPEIKLGFIHPPSDYSTAQSTAKL